MKTGGPTLGKGMKAGEWWSNSWQRDEEEWEHPWEREAWSETESDPGERGAASSSGQGRRRGRRRRRSQSAGSQGSVSGQSQSSGRSTSRSRKKLVWKKKEVERKAWLEANEKAPGLAKVAEEDDRPFTRMLEEMKKKEQEAPPAPLEKGPWKREKKSQPPVRNP